MVKGYGEGEKAKPTRLERLKSGAVRAGTTIRKGAQKFQEARMKFYTETYPKYAKEVRKAQKQFPTTSELIGFEELEEEEEERAIGVETESHKKKKKKSVADFLLG